MKVLVVEDSQSLRKSLEVGLRHAGFTVDSAADGATGLARAPGAPRSRDQGLAHRRSADTSAGRA